MHDNITIKEDQIFIGLKDGGTEWFAFSTAAQLNDVETTFDRVNAFIGQHALPATTEDYDYEALKNGIQQQIGNIAPQRRGHGALAGAQDAQGGRGE